MGYSDTEENRVFDVLFNRRTQGAICDIAETMEVSPDDVIALCIEKQITARFRPPQEKMSDVRAFKRPSRGPKK